jgi:hypothetical protein
MSAIMVCSLVVPVVGVSGTNGWSAGPMPWDWPVTKGRNDDQRAVTDSVLRSTLVSPHAVRILYGENDDRRWHRRLDGADVLGWAVDGVELLQIPEHGDDEAWLFVIHLTAPGAFDPSDGLGHLGDIAPERTTATRQQVDAVVSRSLPGATMRSRPTDRHAYVVSHTVFDDGVDSSYAPVGEPGMPVPLQWTRYLASINSAAAMGGALRESDRQWFDLALSTSWSASVLARGAAFVGLTPASDEYHATGRVLTRSVYLDAVLLGLAQREIVHDLTARVPLLLTRDSKLQDRLALQRQLIDYRAGVWTQTVAESHHMNSVLTTLQRQVDLASEQSELATDISDLAQISAQEANRRITMLLNILIVVSAGAAVAALLYDPGASAAVAGVVASAIIGVALVAWGRYAERTR